MSNATDLGSNKTGLVASPTRAAELVMMTDVEVPLTTPLMSERARVAHQAKPVGSVPAPATFKGMTHTALRFLKGQRSHVLMDKLGQRCAFERTGTRLYDALLSKYDAYGSYSHGPSRDALQKMRNEELAHFHLLAEAIVPPA